MIELKNIRTTSDNTNTLLSRNKPCCMSLLVDVFISRAPVSTDSVSAVYRGREKTEK
jgi:hypothetical protein